MAINFKALMGKTEPAKVVSTVSVATPSQVKKFGGQAIKSPGWFKRGAASASMVEEEDQRVKERMEQIGRMWRFQLEDDEEGRITFVDGSLTPEGLLDILTIREHHLKLGGKWGNFFVCTGELEPCPICEQGADARLVGFLTIIDHREFTSKKSKLYKDRPRLFAATRPVIKTLQSLASKRGGLVGCSFDVMRTGDNAPRCGNAFDFIEKRDPAVLRKLFVATDDKGTVETVFKPANYEDEILYRSANELRKMGFGSGKAAIGKETAISDSVDQHI